MSSPVSSYAVTQDTSKGRTFPEKAHAYRSDFDRDRDRIIHCSAFRRLEGKTQVFTPGLDDYYRTRLTHTIEVAQIARTITVALGLNESLTEAICLGHDLGHPPFGHCGERVLDGLMKEFGGFEHNKQTLRIVDLLEHPYPDFQGLNLMYETRLGLAKHLSPYDKSQAVKFSEKQCSLEGQIADIADRIAYNCHDLEDGMRSRIIGRDAAKSLKIVESAEKKIEAQRISDLTILRTRTAKAIIDDIVSDCIIASREAIKKANIQRVEQVYQLSDMLLVLSDEKEKELVELEKFLFENFYNHESVRKTMDRVQGWLGELFEKLCSNPGLMPGYFQDFIPEHGLERAVCDYIAGMTDRFSMKMMEMGK